MPGSVLIGQWVNKPGQGEGVLGVFSGFLLGVGERSCKLSYFYTVFTSLFTQKQFFGVDSFRGWESVHPVAKFLCGSTVRAWQYLTRK